MIDIFLDMSVVKAQGNLYLRNFEGNVISKQITFLLFIYNFLMISLFPHVYLAIFLSFPDF